MILGKLQNITKELDKSIQSKSLIELPLPSDLVDDIRKSLELIKNHPDQGENITEELLNIYSKLTEAALVIKHNCWNSFQHPLATNERLSEEYGVIVVCENLSIIVEALKLLKSVKWNEEELNSVTSLQKKMKEALQQNAAKQKELEKKIKEEFRKYIENGTIDGISIKKHSNLDPLYTTIKLKEDNKNTDIKISEFLNSDFYKENKIAGFCILNSDQEEIVRGFVNNKGKRCYDLGTTVQYGIKFNWYVDGKERSITLSANSDGSIRVVSDRPTDAYLERNKDVKIKVNNEYLSLADAVKTCKQKKNNVSSKLSQSSITEHFRPLVRT